MVGCWQGWRASKGKHTLPSVKARERGLCQVPGGGTLCVLWSNRSELEFLLSLNQLGLCTAQAKARSCTHPSTHVLQTAFFSHPSRGIAPTVLLCNFRAVVTTHRNVPRLIGVCPDAVQEAQRLDRPWLTHPSNPRFGLILISKEAA